MTMTLEDRQESPSDTETFPGKEGSSVSPEQAKKEKDVDIESQAVRRPPLQKFPSQEGNKRIIVHWDGPDDPENPGNFPKWYKWYITLVGGAILTLNSTLLSSLPAATFAEQMEHFRVSREVILLTLAVYVAGFAAGPLIWSSVSDRYGRRMTSLIALATLICWNIGCAECRNIGSLIVFRFLAGCAAAAPLTNSGSIIADLWSDAERGAAMSTFALAPFAGPALGPVIGGAISVTGTYWRWCYYLTIMTTGGCLLIVLFTIKETSMALILKRRAIKLRAEIGDPRYQAPMELQPMGPREVLNKSILKPMAMLVQEPMLLAITLYTGFIYAVLYMLFEAFPIVFEVIHGFKALTGGLCFLPFFIGGSCCAILCATWDSMRYVRLLKAAPDHIVAPEQRLFAACVGAPLIPIACFWIGWTCYASISFWCPLVATSLLGFGFIAIFISLFEYMADTYLINVGAAFGANTILRSGAGAAAPLFTTQMMTNLNPHWGFSLVGFLALVMVPIPYVLLKFGPKLRTMSKHAMDPLEVRKLVESGGVPRKETQQDQPKYNPNETSQEETDDAEEYLRQEREKRMLEATQKETNSD